MAPDGRIRAASNGKVGRPKGSRCPIVLTPPMVERVLVLHSEYKGVKSICRATGLSRSSVYRVIQARKKCPGTYRPIGR